MAIFDFSQCFDALSVDLVTNDLYNNGVQSDLLNLIYECDAESKIAIKTPHGMTKRRDVKKCVAQGECFSPLKCTVCVDQMAQDHVTNLPGHLYMYKKTVPVPPLGFVMTKWMWLIVLWRQRW